MAKEENREIIMIDECVFSQRSYKQYAWAAVGCNVTASVNWKSERAIAVLGAISSRRGLILWVHREKSMRGQDVEDFLGRLAALTDNIGDAVVLLDNATIHKTNAVRQMAEDKSINLTYNVPYQPQFNGIELFWGQAKKLFRDKVLEIKTGAINARPLAQVVAESIEGVSDYNIKAFCDHSVRLVLSESRRRASQRGAREFRSQATSVVPSPTSRQSLRISSAKSPRARTSESPQNAC